eukprot:m.20748 g.20748  ORF g.20748 m.20748 type:complete len:91 (-) comp11050_c0_seq1:145-417(-)
MMVRASIFDVRSPMLSGAQSTPHSVTSAHHPLVVKQATCVVAGVAMIVRLDSYCRLPQDQAAAVGHILPNSMAVYMLDICAPVEGLVLLY